MGSQKGVNVKQDDQKLILKRSNGDVECKWIQKLYNRRATSQNQINNQRVCLCMIPDDKQWYNDQMIYYTYQLHVKYPEIYFILAIQGMNKENMQQFAERYANLDKLNLVEVTKIENQLHECT